VAVAVFEFGDFKLDCDRFELYRRGRSLRLERKPMELLILLARKNGHLVTRAEIAESLWGKDVFVDTEHGINTAIRKIRQVLRDDPDQPRFVQTVTGKGYRFVIEKKGDAKEQGSGSEIEITSIPSVQPVTCDDMPAEAAVVEAMPASAVVGEDTSPHVQPSESTARNRVRSIRAIAVIAVSLLVIAIVALNFSGTRDRILAGSHALQIHSIAVIPLVNLSGDASQDYYADGMTDELITMLAKNTSLRVVSRTSAMQYRGAKRPLPDIARELGVDGILEGSIERSPNHVHMTVQLIYAPTDTHVWAESYDRELNQAYSLPSELSQTIAKQVKLATSPSSPPRYINPDAHDAYLKGLYVWFQHDSIHSLEYFQKAIQMQPDYAAAWAGLAVAYMTRPIADECPASEVAAQAEAAARKAVELDDSLAEAHHSLSGWYFFYAWDLPHADAESKRAIELNPNLSEAHHLRSYVLSAMNRPDESLQEQKRATELDPFLRNWGLGFAYIQQRQFDAAVNDLQLRVRVLPGDYWTHMVLADAYQFKGMDQQAEQEIEKGLQVNGKGDDARAAHRAFERGGKNAVAQWQLDELKTRARKGYISPLEYANVYASLGDKQKTLQYLEEAYRVRMPWLIMLPTDPAFDFLHTEPRYQALVNRMGLSFKVL
jgi:TolB-like protein/DNA-binding winged helix-turn-helix (wHTH) protein/Tfp pilus assembly protein PilF